jgi:hypothetical protein
VEHEAVRVDPDARDGGRACNHRPVQSKAVRARLGVSIQLSSPGAATETSVGTGTAALPLLLPRASTSSASHKSESAA